MINEPSLKIGGVILAIGAFLSLLQSFGVPLTDPQMSAIQKLVIVGMPVAQAVWTRYQTYDRKSVEIATQLPASIAPEKIDKAIADKKAGIA